ncbi:MAG: hypothetical protein GY820_12890 [Gammaproteobacteria bacterium]|nr:hypothetical protein [Gammaproteobacteria bacterium]
MKCPNCSSAMFVANQNATSKSLVKFFRCTNCVGEHVSSELLSATESTTADTGMFASPSSAQPKYVQIV